MYLPRHFEVPDGEKIIQLIRENSFATVLSFPLGEKPFINHLPVIFDTRPGLEDVLIGHMSKNNPQWRHFQKNPDCTMIFHGPHTYITPRWYTSGRDVPTWNYAVAHLHGKIELIESFREQVEILHRLSDTFERNNPTPWQMALPEDLLDETSLCAAIISFRFRVDRIDAKFKLSQNRSDQDREGVIRGLQGRSDDMSRSVRRMMLENPK